MCVCVCVCVYKRAEWSTHRLVPTAADVGAVLGHSAVHTPSHSDVAEQAQHPPPVDDGRLVARSSAGRRLVPPSPSDSVVSCL